jgi:hypothetical protein
MVVGRLWRFSHSRSKLPRPDGAQDRSSTLCVEARRQVEDGGDLPRVRVGVEILVKDKSVGH